MNEMWHLLNLEEFKVGDIITAYHKGYFRLLSIERRYKDSKEMSPLFSYEKIMDSNFKLITSKKKSILECDARFCKVLKKSAVEDMKKEFEAGCDRLIAILN